MFNVFLAKEFKGTVIHDVIEEDGIVKATIKLPPQCDLKDLKELLNNLKMEAKATDIQISKQDGKFIELMYGMKKLDNDLFPVNTETIKTYITKDSLQIQFPSSFGTRILDFEDGGSCHMLNGGMTRMGKTCLLLYIMLVLYMQNEDDIKFFVCSSKRKDFYPFYDFPVEFAKNPDELMEMLALISDEYYKRNELIESKELRKATDSKTVKKYYPQHYRFFTPIFVIIDEYADYAEEREIQKKIEDLVRKCGYVNIHFVIATQRADARTTISAAIKANLGARICFSTTDKNNSLVILDQEGAEDLGKIQGRAINLDGDTNIIQVPYLEAAACDEILNKYRKGVGDGSDQEQWENYQNEERREDTTLSNKLQSLVEKSISLANMQGEQQTNKYNQSSNEKNGDGWYRLTDSKNVR